MKCICRQKCFMKSPVTGRDARFNPGQVEDFDKCPGKCWEVLEGEVDFATVGGEELMEATWRFNDLAKFTLDEFGIALTRGEGTKKSDVVAQFLDARDRNVDDSDPDQAK